MLLVRSPLALMSSFMPAPDPEFHETSPVELLQVAMQAKAQRRFKAALAAFLRLNALLPDQAAILVAIGTTQVELGVLGAAEASFLQAIVSDPACAAAHANLGSLYVRQGRMDMAAEPSRQAVALMPTHSAAYRNLALALQDTNPQSARNYRDIAYRQQQVFVEPGDTPELTVLVLLVSGQGNVPFETLLPRTRYTRISWFIDYAPPGQEASLPAHDVVFNAVGDAAYLLGAEASMARFLPVCQRPLLNDPARVARTDRAAIGALFSGVDGVCVPETVRLAPGSSMAESMRAAALSFPVLARPMGTHGGDGLQRIETQEVLDATVVPSAGGYLGAFVQTRGPDGFYRKYRVIFVDRVPYPYHLAISPDWMVHYWTAGMQEDAARRAEEMRFLIDPAAVIGTRAMAALEEIGQRMDLDFAGIDFAVLHDGRLVVFEANATMLVHRETKAVFDDKNVFIDRIRTAFQMMLAERASRGRAPDRVVS